MGTIWDVKKGGSNHQDKIYKKYLFSIKINNCILPKCHSGQYSQCDVSVLSKEIKAKITTFIIERYDVVILYLVIRV